MLFLLKLPHIAGSERTTKSKSRSNLFYSLLFLTKKQCDHENHNHIQRSTYEGHQYIYWLKSSSFETQVARRIDMTRLLQSALYSERSLLIGQLSSHPIGQPPHFCPLLIILLHGVVESSWSSEAFSASIL